MKDALGLGTAFFALNAVGLVLPLACAGLTVGSFPPALIGFDFDFAAGISFAEDFAEDFALVAVAVALLFTLFLLATGFLGGNFFFFVAFKRNSVGQKNRGTSPQNRISSMLGQCPDF